LLSSACCPSASQQLEPGHACRQGADAEYTAAAKRKRRLAFSNVMALQLAESQGALVALCGDSLGYMRTICVTALLRQPLTSLASATSVEWMRTAAVSTQPLSLRVRSPCASAALAV